MRIKFSADSQPISGSTFKIYYAMNENGELAGGFSDLSVEVGDLSDSTNASRLASTLAAYAVTGVAQPVSVAVSDGLGICTFTGLTKGTYLVTGNSVFIGDLMYTPKPTLISFSEITDPTVTAGVKYAIVASAFEANERVSRTVKKVWDDNNNEYRLESVTIQLYRNEMPYDEKILSAENNWEYTWDNLNPRFDWNVVESVVPDGYTVSLIPDGETFTVINKSPGTFQTSTTTDIPGASTTTTTNISANSTSTTVTSGTGTVTTNATSTDTNTTNTGTDTTNTNGTDTANTDTSGTTTSSKKGGNTGNSGNSGNSGNLGNSGKSNGGATPKSGSTNGKQPTLPQTGQLWYPVPILFIFGLLLFLIGFVAGGDNEKE